MSKKKGLASISLDADNLWSYKRTHGDADWIERPSYLMALAGRMNEFFSAHAIQPSVMVVGADAAAADGPDFIRALLDMGCEVGNHSFEHEPWLHLYTPEQLRDEIKRTEDAIVAAGAPKPRGFRAPGFSMSPDLMRALVELDYDYDCSVLATWIGPLARQFYLRTNHDLTDEEREQRKGLFGALSDVLLPNKGFTWKAAGNDGRPISLTEIPVTVFPIAKVPMHASYVIYLSGYSMPLAKAYVAASLTACRVSGTEPSLLLHPLDLLDASDAPGLQFFPGMNLPLAKKREVLALVINEMKKHWRLTNMAEHARATAIRATQERDIELLARGREAASA